MPSCRKRGCLVTKSSDTINAYDVALAVDMLVDCRIERFQLGQDTPTSPEYIKVVDAMLTKADGRCKRAMQRLEHVLKNWSQQRGGA